MIRLELCLTAVALIDHGGRKRGGSHGERGIAPVCAACGGSGRQYSGLEQQSALHLLSTVPGRGMRDFVPEYSR